MKDACQALSDWVKPCYSMMVLSIWGSPLLTRGSHAGYKCILPEQIHLEWKFGDILVYNITFNTVCVQKRDAALPIICKCLVCNMEFQFVNFL